MVWMKRSLIIFLIFIFVLISLFLGNKKLKEEEVNYVTGYIASEDKQLCLYSENNNEKCFVRGEEYSFIETTLEDKQYYLLTLDNENYYIPIENVVEDINDVVLETSMFTNIPCVAYKDSEGVEIAEYYEAGSEIKVVGYSQLNEDGSVKRFLSQDGYYFKSSNLSKEKVELAYFSSDSDNDLGGGKASELINFSFPTAEFENNVMPEEVRAIYLSAYALTHIDDYISLCSEEGINAMVIDIKESNGVAYQSESVKKYCPSAYETAVFSEEEFTQIIKKLKENNIYLIARIVAFKDDYYGLDNPDDVLGLNSSGEPYLLFGTYWPSVYSRNVWQYNVSLALEVAQMGFNEVQFDYIRFPSRIENIKSEIDFRNKYDESFAQAVQRFLLYARENLHEYDVYLAGDVFGEVASSFVSTYGQYWPAISSVVDVISPMPYADHFNINSYGIKQAVWTVPGQLLSQWSKDASFSQSLINNPAKVRTWLQGYDSTKAPYTEYNAEIMSQQIEGIQDIVNYNGYMIWNSASSFAKYYQYQSVMKPQN